MANDKINILMTGGGAPGAAGILRCLNREARFNTIVADANPQAVGRYLGHDFEVIPLANDTSFIAKVLDLCRRRNIHVVLPLVTKELIILANHYKEFELAGSKLLVSPAASLEIANDKSRLYQFLQWRGMPVPEFRVVETVAQFKEAVTSLGYPGKSVCFKPSVSNGSRGFRIICADQDDHHVLFNEKPNNTYISVSEATRILSFKPFPQLLVSEYLPGDEYSVDCLANYGEAVLIVPRRRTKMNNGISVEGEFHEEETIIKYCRQILHELQLHGNIGIQVKRSDAGKFLLLEINPRVQGSISAAVGAGVNLPVLAVKQELSMPIEASELIVKWGVKFSKYWNEVFY
ncbi:MAG: ATP-grasp domain-containing protein [Chitinophagaceae bacterium]|nr:ATP-grasp domain-containing protein [Chitinophagaceae bacterium]